MGIFLSVPVFIFGAIVGSFLNVVIFRYHSGATFLGRSMCFSCGKTLLWRDLVPVWGFMMLRGKCRFCRSKISWQYAVVEIITGTLFVLLFWKVSDMSVFMGSLPPSNILFKYAINLFSLFVLGSLLVVIGGYDIKHKIIPDVFAYSFAAIAFFHLIFFPETLPISPIFLDFFAGPILAFPFAFLWYISGGAWMGLGDAKLALGIGWFLGLKAGIMAIVFAFWIGAIFGIAILAVEKFRQSSPFRRRITMKSEIPFAPFLIAGLFMVFFVPRITEFVTLLA